MKRWSRWVTKDIVKLLSAPGVTIEVFPQGGDVDTDNLRITKAEGKGRLYVCGFRTDVHITNPSNTDIEKIEVTDGLDSRGGLNSSDLVTGRLYVDVVTKLRMQGFDVVPCLKDYF